MRLLVKALPWLWDLFCFSSIIGIWPRFIAPYFPRLSFHKHSLGSRKKQPLRIVQISDLHFHEKISPRFLSRVLSKVNALSPDLLVFTGDFLCSSKLDNPQGLEQFLGALQAKEGKYCVLGNHDYRDWVSKNEKGEYSISAPCDPLIRGFQKLIRKRRAFNKSPCSLTIPPHQGLLDILTKTQWTLLHNSSVCIQESLNLCGLGDYSLKDCQADKAFASCKKELPTLVLSHNPNSIFILKDFPGDLILCGHTHGAQVNLPFLWKSLTDVADPRLKRGLCSFMGKRIYVNRGLGALLPFRFFSPPEISLHLVSL